MPSTQETGHTKNVNNFLQLINYGSGFGTKYNPTKEALKIANLTTQQLACEASVKAASKATKIYDDLVDERMMAFDPLQSYATQIISAFSIIDLPQDTVNGAIEINRKIQGKRATPKKDNTKTTTETSTDANTGGSSSASQQSYDNYVTHFSNLIDWVELQPTYNPNEAELKVAAMKLYLDKIDKANKAVIAGIVPYKNALAERDELLYAEKTGLVDTALDVKTYIKSVFKANSPEYKLVSGIAFTRPPKD
ncbi:hypothetical protein ACFOW1_03715 [Parasediminibacterium paludis]|uniref:Uncharacterized protein n=1 Tax=Parasediminibacterium paludis TaxID=908966 RepID=A0ABV8PS52_9BACT